MISATSTVFNSSFFTITGIILIGTIGLLTFILISKAEQVKDLQQTIKKLTASFANLDEQAKIILKTDLDLNRLQQELDKRLTSLEALQRTSRLISTTLDENEIFSRLNKSLMMELGFEKSLIMTLDAQRNLKIRVNAGFAPNKVDRIAANFFKEPVFQSLFKDGRPLSSATVAQTRKQKITAFFDVPNFILSPILTQDGPIGIIFLGNASASESFSEVDEEMASILTNQIGQSLENAKLFEQVYRSRQELELNIQERTRQLAQALEKVQKISKTKSEFVSAVSHELRTPLTSIKGYAAILMSGKLGEIPEPVRERLEKINKHSDNLVELINDLLDIARIESGRTEMKFEKASVRAIVENVRDVMMPQMKEKDIRLSVDIPEGLPQVFVDQNHIERVLTNLLSNAAKYAPGSNVQVKAALQNKEVLLQVSDSGAGIKPEDLSRVFDEFYRVDNEYNQTVKGTGLGLSLAKNIIEAHGGKIWAESVWQKGTTFSLTLPTSPKTDKDTPDPYKKPAQGDRS